MHWAHGPGLSDKFSPPHDRNVMLTHDQIWSGLDALAQRYALSPSGLAKLAGLDPTTFNRSKRFAGASDKPRWPSTESIAKVLEATGASFEEFAALATDRDETGQSIPLLRLDHPDPAFCFDQTGVPTGDAWERAGFPGAAGAALFAIEIVGEAHEPVFREGDRLVAAAGQSVEAGDRVILALENGAIDLGVLDGITARQFDLAGFAPGARVRRYDVARVAWIARILWASQ